MSPSRTPTGPGPQSHRSAGGISRTGSDGAGCYGPRWRGQCEHGEEAIGIQDVQEERHRRDLPPGDLQHLQRPWRIAARRIGPVLPEGRAAVGCGRHQAGAPAGARSGLDHPAADVGCSLNPHGEGRHRLHRIFSQHDHQTLDVVAFECVHVALEEVEVGRVERLGPGLGRQRAQCGPGPLQGTVDGGHARVEELRHLGHLPTKDLTEDQGGALARRKMLQRGDEGQADRVAVCDDLRGVRSPRSHTGVGHRGHPGRLG